MIILKMRVVKMRYAAMLLALLLPVLSFGKGHGGHGGGHGGGSHGHSGASHSAGRSAAMATGGQKTARAPQRTVANNRAAYRSMAAASGRAYPVGPNGRVIEPVHPGYYGYTYEHGIYGYGYPGYYGNYGYSPLFYDPFFGMFAFGGGMVYTPHYNYAQPGNDNNAENGSYMDGYAVYAMDTINGAVKLTSNAVFIESKDSVRNYDYKFRLKQKELSFVSLYNTDGTQVCLTRIKAEPKKLWRIVHEGKLNVYDENYGFIYRPEDIDYRTVMVMYNGEPQHIGSASKAETKQRLAEFMSRAYQVDLNPNDFSWKQLLVYLDKLD